MNIPTLEELELIRKEGFKPGFIMCFVHKQRVLFLYKREYILWMFPQGSVEIKENFEQALSREIKEKLGEVFLQSCTNDIKILGQDKAEFLPGKYDVDTLKLSDGSTIPIKGKVYFFFSVRTLSDILDISQIQFDEYFWLDYQSSRFLAERIHQTGKKRITVAALNLLKENGLLL